MKENRKYPRISKILPIKISSLGNEILTETQNVSGNGAYCAISKSIDEMTKLDIVLIVPVQKDKLKGIKKINCKGVVVRSQYVPANTTYPYQVGIYFSAIKESDRKLLLNYINTNTHMPKHSYPFDASFS